MMGVGDRIELYLVCGGQGQFLCFQNQISTSFDPATEELFTLAPGIGYNDVQ